MKRCIILSLMLLGIALLIAQPYAQNLFFSEYIEGSSNNKAIEIFNGTGATVDLSQYTVKLGSNGGTWSTTNILTPTGTLANNDVFVIANSQANAAILAVSDVTSTVTYFNGDDCLGLFQGDTLIDIIGIYQNDPGTAWPVAGVADATLNHTLIRKSTVTQGNTDWTDSAGTNTDDSEWTVEAQDYVTDLGMHTFEPGGGNNVATPVFNPGGGTYTNPVSVTITCSTPSSSIFYTTDGSVPTPTSTPYTGPITINGTTTLKAMATAAGMDDSSVATAVYTFPVSVANIAALRSQPLGSVYYLAGEAVLTFQQSSRNQKYIQDGSAAIVIDDPSGIITTTYSLGDGITGILGTLGAYYNLLQFTPVQDPGPASSTGNVITPEVRTFASLDPEDQAKLIKVLDVTIDTTLGNFPATATNINATDPTTTLTLRTFPNAEYSNTPIPTAAVHLVCLVGQYNDAMQVSPRFLSDFESTTGVAAPTFDPPSGSYTQAINVTISCATTGADIFYTLDGSDPYWGSTPYTNPIPISSTTTVKAIAYLGTPVFSPISTAIYSFPTDVASLTALRQSPLNGLYRINGEIVVSFVQSNRHQKFTQDGGAGILIDDPSGVITTAYQAGDGMENLVGTLTEYGGMLELTPALDPGAPSSTQNNIVPIEITLAQFNSGFETYESRLVKIMDVRFTTPTGNFATGTNYAIEDLAGGATASFRTSFYDVDYIGIPVYTYGLNITGIPNSRTDGNYITSRDIAGFQISEVMAPLHFETAVVNEHTVNFWVGYDTTYNQVVPDGLTGYRIYRNGTIAAEGAAGIQIAWTDDEIPAGTNVYYATAMFGTQESDPTESFTHIVTANPENPPAALETVLEGNWPNPFNPSTTLSFSLGEAGHVAIDIFNQKGQLVRHLVDQALPAGRHQAVWNGLDGYGSSCGSGIYYYRMRCGSYTNTRKMLMLK
jgi:hypothetical protein